jgi:hypothetical protein
MLGGGTAVLNRNLDCCRYYVNINALVNPICIYPIAPVSVASN